MDKDCIFCKIASNEIPAYCIYEDEDFKAFLDRYPACPGHTVIIPKKHVPDLFALDNATAAKLLPLAVKLAGALKKALPMEGLNMLQNNGAAAGQTISHYHIHLIPRYEKDDIVMKWNAKDPAPEEFERLQEAVLRITSV